MLGFESPTHIVIVLLIALLVFGPKRLPEMGRSLGQGIRQFRSSLDSHDALPEADPAPAPHVEAPVSSSGTPQSGATPR